MWFVEGHHQPQLPPLLWNSWYPFFPQDMLIAAHLPSYRANQMQILNKCKSLGLIVHTVVKVRISRYDYDRIDIEP